MKKSNDSKSQGMSPPNDLVKWLEIADRYSHPNDDDENESLVRALEDPDESVRKIVVNALIMLNDLYAASSIIGVLLGGSKHARLAAAEVLGKLGDPFAFFYLGKALKDPDPEVRVAVIEGYEKLGRIGWILYTEMDERFRDAFEPLLWTLEDPDESVRKAAVRTLGRLGDQRAIEPLRKLLEKVDGGIHKAIVKALNNLGAIYPSDKL